MMNPGSRSDLAMPRVQFEFEPVGGRTSVALVESFTMGNDMLETAYAPAIGVDSMALSVDSVEKPVRQ